MRVRISSSAPKLRVQWPKGICVRLKPRRDGPRISSLFSHISPNGKTMALTEKQKSHLRIYQKVRRAEQRRIIDEHKASHPCIDCGESDPICLDFDHRDPSKKDFSIFRTTAVCGTVEALLKEIAKCDIRCANCHRKKTHRNKEGFHKVRWV